MSPSANTSHTLYYRGFHTVLITQRLRGNARPQLGEKLVRRGLVGSGFQGVFGGAHWVLGLLALGTPGLPRGDRLALIEYFKVHRDSWPEKKSKMVPSKQTVLYLKQKQRPSEACPNRTTKAPTPETPRTQRA